MPIPGRGTFASGAAVGPAQRAGCGSVDAAEDRGGKAGESAAEEPALACWTGSRLASLDVLRGLAVVMMLLVGNPGDAGTVYPVFVPSVWHGAGLADLVWPFFVFAMGAAFVLRTGRPGADAKPGDRTSKRWRSSLRHARRVLLLVGLGLGLNALLAWDLEAARATGVLQRLGLVYAALVLASMLAPAVRFVLAGAVLLVWWWLLAPHGAVTDTSNPARTLDLALLGEGLVWQGAATDPEGLAGVLPAAVTGLLGCWAGVFVRDRAWSTRSVLRLAGAGVLLALLGRVWGEWVPLNRTLWTPSFALLSGGVGMVVFAACVWCVEVRRCRWLTSPLEVFGQNALLIYVGSVLLAWWLVGVKVGVGQPKAVTAFAFDELVGRGVPHPAASLGIALALAAVWWPLAWALARWRIRVRV